MDRRSNFAFRRSIALAAALAAVAGGCGGGAADGTAVGRDGAVTSTAAEAIAPHCRRARPRKARSVSYQSPGQLVKKGEALSAVVQTNCGTFSIELDTARSPTVVNSFVFLANRGFYDGMPFDKAGAGRYLHGGDPPGGAGGPGFTVPGRIPRNFIYRHGVVAMEGPRRAGSQFFIVLAKPWLDFSGIYPPLGTIERGFGVLDAISRLGPGSAYPPNAGVLGPIGKLRRPVVIEAISIKRDKR